MSADTRPYKAGQIAEGTDANGARHALLVSTAGVLQVGGLDADGNPQSLANVVAAGVAGTPYDPAILPVGNSSTATFQTGARDWSVLVLTAGVTVGGQAIPAGVTLTMPGPLAGNLAVVTDGSGMALLMCNGTIA